MTRRDFDRITKRNHGHPMAWLERCLYEHTRPRMTTFDLLAARERWKQHQARLGAVGSLFERDSWARARYRSGATVSGTRVPPEVV